MRRSPNTARPGGGRQLSLLGHRLLSGGGFWDPAYGRPGSGDASVLAATYADGEGNHYLHRLSYLTHDPDSPTDPATQQCHAVAGLARELLLPAIRVETNGLGRFLPALLRRALAEAGAPAASSSIQPPGQGGAHPGGAGTGAGGAPAACA